MRAGQFSLVLLLVLAAGLRCGWVAYQWQQRGPELTYPDEQLHWTLATHLVQRGEMVSDDGRYAARMPAYPALLAAFAWIGPGGVLAARLFQALLGTVTVGVVWWLAGRAFGPRAAVLAAALVALDPYQVFFSHLLLSEVTFTLLLTLAGACVWRCIAPGEVGPPPRTDADDRPWLQLAAAALALGLLTRPSSAGWVLALIIMLTLIAPGWGRALSRLAVCTAMLAAFMVPWAVRNMVVLGEPALLGANGGASLYDAVGPDADGSSDQSFIGALPEIQDLGELERDRRLGELARRTMADDPGRVLRLAIVKLARTWNPFPNVQEYRSGRAAWVGALYTLTLIGLALVGLLRGVRDRPRYFLLIALPVFYFTLVHMVYIGSVRYRVPLMPLLALAAAPAISPTRDYRREPGR